MRSPHRAFLALWVLSMVFPVAPLSFNRTIDDEAGDCVTGVRPMYSPEGFWAQGSSCPACGVSTFVDTSQVFDGTWHDTTYLPDDTDRTISMTFTGHAVYIYHILAYIPGITTLTDLRFYLDNQFVGQFVHEFSPTLEVVAIWYQVPVYANTTLTNTQHTLLIRATGQNASLVLFDQVVYSIELPDTYPITTSPSNEPLVVSSISTYSIPFQSATSTSAAVLSGHPISTSLIVGASIAGVVALSSLLALLFILRKRTTIRQPLRSRSPGCSTLFDGGHPSREARPFPLTWRPISRAMREDVSEAVATIDASIGPSRQDGVVSILCPPSAKPTRRDIIALRAEVTNLREQWREAVDILSQCPECPLYGNPHGAIPHKSRVEDPIP